MAISFFIALTWLRRWDLFAPSAFVSSPIACGTRLCRLATRDIASAKTIINRFMPCSPIPFSEGHGRDKPASRAKNKTNHKGWFCFLVAEMGFEPHDLRVMSPTSYQTAPLRDIGAGSRGRTGTRNKSHGILSPGRLPIPPFRHTTTLDFLIAIILYHHFPKLSIPFFAFFKKTNFPY